MQDWLKSLNNKDPVPIDIWVYIHVMSIPVHVIRSAELATSKWYIKTAGMLAIQR